MLEDFCLRLMKLFVLDTRSVDAILIEANPTTSLRGHGNDIQEKSAFSERERGLDTALRFS
ncbi:MAG: hypothetical protein CVV47_14935 [Spirochaetae bacterium HGW-Spirochaetae-3]|nr:MAG: hypothetical protein CVV47_14935 [Spirochaetae bacterium HGW-Spirochaetae-3]